jgi:hypothetical protein
MKYGIYFRMIPLQYKNPVMETGILNIHDDEHFSSISSPLYDQVLFVIAEPLVCVVGLKCMIGI